MAFTSFTFLLFFAIVLIVNYCIPQKYRYIFLLIASFYFYLNWQPIYAVLLTVTILISYFTGKLLSGKNLSNKWRKTICGLGIGLSIIPLFLFKYYNFITSSISGILTATGISIDLPRMELLLPLGISFYTFSSIGYIIDCYRNKYDAVNNILILALFISFFAHISSGPIPRGDQLIPQLIRPEDITYNNVIKGLHKMLWGFFLKLCIADRIGLYVDSVYGNIENHNGGSLLLASILYTIQIYCDFAGYSLMAIGAARMLGIRLMENFRRPYFATSIKDFWGRWHISLSTWFRDYLYIPLGGNRVSKIRKPINLLTTFLISGLWHGASWNFVAWGGLHGTSQAVEKYQKTRNEIKYRWLRIIFVFIFVSFAWVFFRLTTANSLGLFWHKLATQIGLPFIDMVIVYVIIALTILFIVDYIAEFKPHFFAKISSNFWISNILSGLLLAAIVIMGVFGNNSFIYFAF